MASTFEGTAASPAEPGLPRKPWYSDVPDRLLLLLFFFGGFVAILLIKLAGRGLVTLDGQPVEPRFLAAGLAALLLVLYAAVASQTRTFKLHPERLGDNCYYLGLLYTLASLAAALIELERAVPEARTGLLESLLASFGVALTSTILGIALRVWFVQMRREIEDLEAELQRDLREAAQKLKDQLLYAVTDLESFRLRTRQVLDERLNEASAAVADSAVAQAKSIEEFAQRACASLEPVVEPLAARVQDFSQTSRAIFEAGRDLARRLNAVEIPTDLLSGPAQDLQREVETLSASVDKLETLTRRLVESLEGQFGALEVRLSGLATPLARFVQGIESAAAAGRDFEGLARAVEQFQGGFAEFEASLGQFVAAMHDDAKHIRSLRDQIRSDLSDYQRAQRELMTALVDISESVVRRLGG